MVALVEEPTQPYVNRRLRNRPLHLFKIMYTAIYRQSPIFSLVSIQPVHLSYSHLHHYLNCAVICVLNLQSSD